MLEILHRLPLNDLFKEYAKDVMDLLMQIVKTDNEDNAVCALKVMIDLHRHYKTIVADQVQPFLDFVFEMYTNMPTIVKESFDTNSNIPGSTPAATVTPAKSSPNNSLHFLLNLIQDQTSWRELRTHPKPLRKVR